MKNDRTIRLPKIDEKNITLIITKREMQHLHREYLSYDRVLSYACNFCGAKSNNEWKYRCKISCKSWTEEIEIKF